MRIIWDETSRQDWRALVARVPQANLLNTWAYAHAVRLHKQMMTRFGVIEVDGAARGLVQVQEVGLGKVIQALTFHRGPLWLDEPASQGEWQDFLALYAASFARRPGRMRRFLPELEDTPEARSFMKEAGFRRIGEGYQTLWLDLRAPADELRKGLAGKWRNALNGGEKSGLVVDIDTSGAHAKWLLGKYGADKSQRGYGGAKPEFLQQMVFDLSSDGDAIILRALDAGEPVAGILLIRHGVSATYQVGWSSDAGRKTRAHHVLLWQAITLLKANGVLWFDLGGINKQEAEGVWRFKAGLGASEYKTVGLYK